MTFQIKLTLLFTLLIAVLIGGLFYEFDTTVESYLRNTAIKNFHAIVETSEGAYFAFADKIKTRTLDWSSDGAIRAATGNILSLPEGEEHAAAVNNLARYLREEKLKHDPSISIIDILDKNGIVVVSSRADRIGIDEKKEEEKFHAHRFSEAIASPLFREVFVTNVVYEPDEGMEPMIHAVTRIFSAVKDAQGNLVPMDAVMLLHFTNIDELGNILSGQQQIEQGALSGRVLFEYLKTADIYMVNKDNLIITPSRFVGDALLKLRVNTYPVKACLEEGREIAGEYTNYRGIRVFGASMCLVRDHTVLIAEVQADEILAPIKAFRSKLALASILIALAGALGVSLLSRFFLRNLKPIALAVNEVALGNASVRAKIKGHDEIAQVGLVFNQMLDAIEKTGRELQDAQTKLTSINTDLEQRVKERTGELEQLKAGLEQTVMERTQEMKEKMEELEKFKKLTVGRELKMIELKKEIEMLKNK
ncbi:HAMP domain-containing protein [Candidatus Azambacteria bacterium]|nr:HAMP domain-containing protein [Candidatus Azambacteria bacterium]